MSDAILNRCLISVGQMWHSWIWTSSVFESLIILCAAIAKTEVSSGTYSSSLFKIIQFLITFHKWYYNIVWPKLRLLIQHSTTTCHQALAAWGTGNLLSFLEYCPHLKAGNFLGLDDRQLRVTSFFTPPPSLPWPRELEWHSEPAIDAITIPSSNPEVFPRESFFLPGGRPERTSN